MADLCDVEITFAPDSYRLNHSASTSWRGAAGRENRVPLVRPGGGLGLLARGGPGSMGSSGLLRMNRWRSASPDTEILPI